MPQTYSHYPEPLRTELDLLDRVGRSASAYLGYVSELIRAASSNDKTRVEAVIDILFGKGMALISQTWVQDYWMVDNLINHVAKPVLYSAPNHDDWIRPSEGKLPARQEEENKDRREATKNVAGKTTKSAHEVAVQTSWMLLDLLQVCGIMPNYHGQSLSEEQWNLLRKLVPHLSHIDYEDLRSKVEQESVAANDYARVSVVGTAGKEPSKLPFVSNVFQQAILKALEGRALNKQGLADKVCGGDGSRLYRTGGIKELRDAGLVDHKDRLGYYRPDSPPL